MLPIIIPNITNISSCLFSLINYLVLNKIIMENLSRKLCVKYDTCKMQCYCSLTLTFTKRLHYPQGKIIYLSEKLPAS